MATIARDKPLSACKPHTVRGLLVCTTTVVLFGTALLLHRGNLLGIAALALFLVGAEQLFAIHRRSIHRQGWSADVVHLAVNRALSGGVLVSLLAVLAAAIDLFMPDAVPDAVVGQPAWLQLIEVLVLIELGSYWSHRALHAIPALWRFHRLHHGGTELDWLVAFRRHPVDLLFGGVCTVMPVLALGFSEPVYGAVFLLGTALGAFEHANVRVTLGRLRWVVASPEFHHWHHAAEPMARDANYALIFPMIDRLFGTMHMPVGRRPDRFGIDTVVPKGYLEQHVWVFTEPVTTRILVSATDR